MVQNNANETNATKSSSNETNGSTPRELFLQSVQRCTASAGFIPSFYERFLAISDEIRSKFLFTKFEKQNEMLRRSLELCAGATAGEPDSLAEINERAETHDRHHLNIDAHLYEYWLEAIIETAQEFDQEWSDEVELAWRRILGFAVQHMTRKY